jgi:nucleoside-diphosphate-sugar epimerase
MAEYLIGVNKPDVVVHLAAQVGIYFNECDCANAIDANATMTLRVAKACASHGARLVHTSTSEVYGDHGDQLVDENEPLTAKPTGIYAISKRWSEDAAREYAPDGLVIIRPSMPYGAGAPPGRGRRAMDNMLWQAHHRKPIAVHRNSYRSWCHISDVCRGYQMIIESGAVGAFNVGRDDDERSMHEIALRSCELAGAPTSLIQLVDPPAKKTMIKRLSTRRLFEMGWKPEIDLETGMINLYEWIKQFNWIEQ